MEKSNLLLILSTELVCDCWEKSSTKFRIFTVCKKVHVSENMVCDCRIVILKERASERTRTETEGGRKKKSERQVRHEERNTWIVFQWTLRHWLNVEMPLAERAVKESVTFHLCACLNTCLSAHMHCTNHSNTMSKLTEGYKNQQWSAWPTYIRSFVG